MFVGKLTVDDKYKYQCGYGRLSERQHFKLIEECQGSRRTEVTDHDFATPSRK